MSYQRLISASLTAPTSGAGAGMTTRLTSRFSPSRRDQALHLGLRGEVAGADAGRHQRLLQALAHDLLELARRLRRDLRGQRQLVTLGVELAVHLECRDLLDRLAHQGIADDHAGMRAAAMRWMRWSIRPSRIARLLSTLSNARASNASPCCARACWRACSKLRAELVDGDRLVVPEHGNRPPRRRRLPPVGRRVDLGDAVVGALDEVLLQAEEGEGNDQQAEDHRGDPARSLVAEFLQHIQVASRRKPDSLARLKPASAVAEPVAAVCFTDGTPGDVHQACSCAARRDDVGRKKKAPFPAPLAKLAEWTGLEPATSGVTGQHSNRLNYHSALDLLDGAWRLSLRCGDCNRTPSSMMKNKGAVSGALGRTGGVDGTRTRDLRRDRPAF